MKQKHIKRWVVPYLEGRLSEKDKMAVEQHLNRCGDCREFYQLVKEVEYERATNIFPELQADPFLPTRIKTQFKKRELPIASNLKYIFRMVLTGIAIVASIFLGILMGKQFHQQANDETETIITAYSDILYEDPPAVDFILENSQNQNQEEKP